jgi:hypothetical protein
VDVLVTRLTDEDPAVRSAAAEALGKIGDRRAVEPLIEVLAQDGAYEARQAAAAALGLLKESRAIWVLVATLKLRDESGPERQEALQALQQQAQRALQKIGDPLAAGGAAKSGTATPEAPLPADEAAKGPVLHHRLQGNLRQLPDLDLITVLKELVGASEEVSWSKVENREPLLPGHFKSYEQRRLTAEVVGRELHRRGGSDKMRQVLSQDLKGHEAIANWWAGLELGG